MNYIILAVLVISIFGIRLRKEKLDGYISPAQTSAINGVFVMLVFMRHINQYLTFGKYDNYFQIFDSLIGQLIVTTFLFYSGYGIMYSFINKDNYANTMPKRILKILLQFDVAIIFYIIVNIIIGQERSVSEILLAFFAWTSLGNSTWYIFAILCLYLFSFIAGKLFTKNNLLIVFAVTFGGVIYILFTRHFGKPSHWYNTIFCYPAGMFFAICSSKINSILKNNRFIPILSLIVTIVLFATCFYLSRVIGNPYLNLLSFELAAIFFVLAIVSFTTIFIVSNPILVWFGKYLFEIYILQRIPMLLLAGKLANKYIYFFLCFAITLLLAIGYKYIEKYISKAVDKIQTHT